MRVGRVVPLMPMLALLFVGASGADEIVYRWPARFIIESETPIPDTDPPLKYLTSWSTIGPEGTVYTAFAAYAQAYPEAFVYNGIGCNRGNGFEILATSLDEPACLPDDWFFFPFLDVWMPFHAFADGSVLFVASTTDDPDDSFEKGLGHFVARPGEELTGLMITATEVPGGDEGETYKYPHRIPAFNRSGDLTGYASTLNADGVSDFRNFVLMAGTKDDVSLYRRHGDPAPGFPSGTYFTHLDNSMLRLNSSGSMVIDVFAYGVWGNLAALYADCGEGPQLLAHQGQTIPDMAPWFFNTGFNRHWIDDHDRIVFRQHAINPDGPPWRESGIWLIRPGEEMETLFFEPIPFPALWDNALLDPDRLIAYLNNDGNVLLYCLQEQGEIVDAPRVPNSALPGGQGTADASEQAQEMQNGYADPREVICIGNIDTKHILPTLVRGQTLPDLPDGSMLASFHEVQGNKNNLYVMWVELDGPEVTHRNKDALIVMNQYGERRVVLRKECLLDLSDDGSDIRRYDWPYDQMLPDAKDNLCVLNDRNELVLDMRFDEPLGRSTWVFDLSEMVACGPDLNNDDFVDQHDLGLLLAAYGTTPGEAHWSQRADINLDGVVDQADLQEVLMQYEQVCE